MVSGAVAQLTADGRIMFRCPGCGWHVLNVDPSKPGPCWGFNGDLERPTFTPSILTKAGHYCASQEGQDCWCTYEARLGRPAPFSCFICHNFVTDGRIQFLSDSTHHLAGQTVDLMPFDAEAGQ